jgi:hypothetical protein
MLLAEAMTVIFAGEVSLVVGEKGERVVVLSCLGRVLVENAVPGVSLSELVFCYFRPNWSHLSVVAQKNGFPAFSRVLVSLALAAISVQLLYRPSFHRKFH